MEFWKKYVEKISWSFKQRFALLIFSWINQKQAATNKHGIFVNKRICQSENVTTKLSDFVFSKTNWKKIKHDM